jgi:hypothetical protein
MDMRVTRRFAALSIAAAIATSGCRATFTDPRVPAGEQKSRWADFFVLGAVGHEEVDIRDYCASARAREVVLGADVFTVLVSVVTLGIYTPRKVTVTCAKAAAAPAAKSR